jgi:hypothetical protein
MRRKSILSPRTRFGARLASLETIGTLKPAIRKIAGLVEQGHSLTSAAGKAFEDTQDLGQSFAGISDGDPNFRLKDHLLYPPEGEKVSEIFIQLPDAGRFVFKTGEDQSVADMAELISQAAIGEFDGERVDSVDEFCRIFSANAFVDASAYARRRLGTGNGITRLQHAGLLITHNGHGVLFDPQFNSSFCPDSVAHDIGLCDLDVSIDGVFISHSHGDHFHVPSLMMLGPERPIYVPAVPRASLLCPDMKQLLVDCGLGAHALAWYAAPVRVGDIEVFALPFFGEQPLAKGCWRDSRIRNWGNTYFVRTPESSYLILIDSGSDHEGTMLEVAAYVRKEFGHVDVVLSNLKEFRVGQGSSNPFYITGYGQYWLSLTPEQMAAFGSLRGQTITLAPEGVAEMCRLTGAAAFLPYAHWWTEPGTAARDETYMLRAVAQAGQGVATTLLEWNVGDSYSVGLNSRHMQKSRFETKAQWG